MDSNSHAEKIERAKKYLDNDDGRAELLRDIAEGLLVNLQIEAEEGKDPGETAADRQAARQCRKQYKETAEIVIQVVDRLNGGTR